MDKSAIIIDHLLSKKEDVYQYFTNTFCPSHPVLTCPSQTCPTQTCPACPSSNCICEQDTTWKYVYGMFVVVPFVIILLFGIFRLRKARANLQYELQETAKDNRYSLDAIRALETESSRLRTENDRLQKEIDIVRKEALRAQRVNAQLQTAQMKVDVANKQLQNALENEGLKNAQLKSEKVVFELKHKQIVHDLRNSAQLAIEYKPEDGKQLVQIDKKQEEAATYHKKQVEVKKWRESLRKTKWEYKNEEANWTQFQKLDIDILTHDDIPWPAISCSTNLEIEGLC